jgi:hypothetical protein
MDVESEKDLKIILEETTSTDMLMIHSSLEAVSAIKPIGPFRWSFKATQCQKNASI